VPHQAALLDAWTDALVRGGAPASEEARRARDEALQTMLSRLSAGEMDALLADEAREAEQAARTGSASRRAPSPSACSTAAACPSC
jgi:hypothetical protein